MAQISASVPESTISQIDKIAKKEKRSFSFMVAALLQEALDKREKTKK